MVRKLTEEQVEDILLSNGFQRAEGAKYLGSDKKMSLVCSCGKIFDTTIHNIRNGNTKTCGHCDDPEIGDIAKNGMKIINIRRTGNANGCSVIAQCRCGKLIQNGKWIKWSYIKNCVTDTCGNCNNPIVGHKINNLTVVDVRENRLGIGCCVKAKCDCGNMFGGGKWISWGALINKKTCGQCNAPVIGKKYGSLTVLSTYYINDCGKRMVECICDCGNKINIQWYRIVTKNTKSCGCVKSHGNKKIGNILRRNNISYVAEYQIEDCKNILPLRFDFYLTDYNILIEYQGQQHYEPVFGIKPFIISIKHDKIKRRYCKKHNIALYAIPYTYFDTLETIVLDIVKGNKVKLKQPKIIHHKGE
jgi:hypothetical protein